jgi:TonB-linked SusC/RagA family outer membrane protein
MKKKVLQMLLTGMLILLSSSAYSQLKVSGVVKSNTGETLPGATIVVKGTTIGTAAGADGSYSITVPNAQSVLVVSFIGMTVQEIPVNGKSVIDVSLASETAALDEVVVTALGISKAKKSLAYSVGEVKSESLVQAGNINAMKSLDGKISGVNLTSLSSDPTSSVLVNVRGTTTMPTAGDPNVSKKGQPLYVIDGVAVGRQSFTSRDGVDFGNILSQLNPEDIESITVLKAGSAGALYGSEGGNGVVMITTKSGKGGKKGIGVSLTSSFTTDHAYNFIESQHLYGQGERAYEWQYDNTDTWGPKLDGSYTSKFWNVKTQAWETAPQYSSGEDRMKEYLQNGSTLSNTVSINGNYDQGAFRLSFSNLNNSGVMPNTQTKQTSIALNSEYKLAKDVKVSVNANYITTFSPNKANATGSNSVLNDLLFNFPDNLQPLSDMTNYWLTGFEGINQNGAIMKDPASSGVAQNNPWYLTYENIHRFTRNNFFGKVQVDWKIAKNWSLMVRSGLDDVYEGYELRKSWGNRSDLYGQYNPTQSSSTLLNNDAIISYNNNFGKFSLNVSAGANYTFGRGSSSDMNAGDLTSPALFLLSNARPNTLTSSYLWSTSQSSSVYGTASMGWNNQFFVDITGRQDWKGVLDEEKINYFYPSVSGSWVISETFQLPKIIDLLKARIGWADVGNGLERTRNIDVYSYESPDWGSVKTVNISATLVDPNIIPTHSVTKEAGFDLWMMKKRLAFDFTYFIKDQLDQQDLIPTVPGTGYPGMWTNIGDVRGKGYEWGITFVPVQGKDWNWDFTASFTHYKANITRLADQFIPNGYAFASYDGKTKVKIAEGEEIGNIYEENPIMKVKTGMYAGQYLLDSDGKFQKSADERDRGKLGNFNPDYILGLNSTLRYKQFSFTAVGGFRVGGEYVSVNQQYMESNGRALSTIAAGPNNPLWVGGRDPENGGLPWPAAGASDYDVINNWNEERYSTFNDASYARGVFLNPDYTGDPAEATDADYIVNGADPNNTFYDFPYNAYGDCIWNFTSTRTYDATNFKLREVTLSYSIPNSITNKIKMYDVTISFIGRNLFQWNKNGRNEDPESAFSGVGTNQGILRATLPSIASYGFKIGVNF